MIIKNFKAGFSSSLPVAISVVEQINPKESPREILPAESE